MNNSKSHKGFTLVEMLIVIGILAILVAVVVSVLNPAEFFKQTRDSRRLSDLNQLDKALNLATLDNVSMGTANVVYLSVPDNSGGATTTCSGMTPPVGWTYQCSNSDNYRKVDGTGWVPVDFSSLVTVPSALTLLPIDPINSTSTNLFYTYTPGSWELTALFETTKYQTKYPGFGTSTVYTAGNHQGISPNNIAMRTGTGGGGEGTTQYTLIVNKTGDGSGTVTSNPSGIDCGSTCNYDFDDDTEVTLTAEAAGGSTFTAWSGEGCSGTGTCVVTLSEDREVTANFDVAGPQTGYVDPNGSVQYQMSQWPDNPPWTTNYMRVDDGIRQPTEPDITDYLFNGGTDIFDMTTFTVDSISNIKVWVYSIKGGPMPEQTVTLSIFVDGDWVNGTAISPTDTKAWYSSSFDGTWTQEDLDALRVKVNSGMPYIYAVYAEVTYTQ
ncbi:MAG: type II secretion system protein [Candidatus Omnitrophota bacterium]